MTKWGEDMNVRNGVSGQITDIVLTVGKICRRRAEVRGGLIKGHRRVKERSAHEEMLKLIKISFNTSLCCEWKPVKPKHICLWYFESVERFYCGVNSLDNNQTWHFQFNWAAWACSNSSRERGVCLSVHMFLLYCELCWPLFKKRTAVGPKTRTLIKVVQTERGREIGRQKERQTEVWK